MRYMSVLSCSVPVWSCPCLLSCPCLVLSWSCLSVCLCEETAHPRLPTPAGAVGQSSFNAGERCHMYCTSEFDSASSMKRPGVQRTLPEKETAGVGGLAMFAHFCFSVAFFDTWKSRCRSLPQRLQTWRPLFGVVACSNSQSLGDLCMDEFELTR